MDDRKPSTEPGPADPPAAARLVHQFLASFKRRAQGSATREDRGSADTSSKPAVRGSRKPAAD